MNKYLYAIAIVAAGLLIWLLVLLMRGNIVEENNKNEEPGCGTESSRSFGTKQDSIVAIGEKLFNSNCTSCHAINEKIVGPALKDVSLRHNEKWLIAFIRDAQTMISEGDPEAVKIYKENNELPMTSFTSLSDDQIKAILEYIKSPARSDIIAD